MNAIKEVVRDSNNNPIEMRSLFIHFKGSFVIPYLPVIDTTSGEDCIAYVCLKDGKTYIRPVKE